MKFITIGFMLWGGLLCGQTVIAPVVEGGASVPAPPCVTGQVYFNTGAAAGQNLYVCASNTWTQINGAAANGVSTNASNTYAAGTVQSFLGTLDASGAAATLPAQTGATLPATCSTGQLFLKTRFQLKPAMPGTSSPPMAQPRVGVELRLARCLPAGSTTPPRCSPTITCT